MNFLRVAYTVLALTFACVVYVAPSHSAAKAHAPSYVSATGSTVPQSGRCGLICLVVLIFRGIGQAIVYIVQGIANFFLGIVKGIGNMLQGIVNLVRGARFADEAEQVSRTGSKAIDGEEARKGADGSDARNGDGETLARFASEGDVAAEQAKIARECGGGAAAIAAGNAAIFQGCLSETTSVREACTDTSRSSAKEYCELNINVAQVNCSVAGSASFFLELGAACYSYAAAR